MRVLWEAGVQRLLLQGWQCQGLCTLFTPVSAP